MPNEKNETDAEIPEKRANNIEDATQSTTDSAKTAPTEPTGLVKPFVVDNEGQPISVRTEKSTEDIDKSSTDDESTDTTEADKDPADSKGLDDDKTDVAVNDIVTRESDQVLADEDALTSSAAKTKKTNGRIRRFFTNKWTWIVLAVIIVALFALPYTRYKILGLVIKKTFTVKVIDSKSDTPVSSALVALDGVSAKTDAYGNAKLHVPVGKATLSVSEQYYRYYSHQVFVGLKSNHTLQLSLVATGRQVPIKVVNSITNSPVDGAVITALNTSAKTNAKGQATIVLPTTSTSDSASVSLPGYNTIKTTVTVTSSAVATNNFKLTPSGKIYFLSNASGKIDVMEANLDGSQRQTVLAGTGQEDPNSTILLASHDWRYLALQTQRNSGQPGLYVIDTSTNKSTEIDSTNALFNLIGWSGDDFLYDASKNAVPTSSAGHEVVKSYNAQTAQLNQLDQNQVVTGSSSYAYQSFANFTINNGSLLYNTQWYDTGTTDLSGQSTVIRTVQASGQGKKDLLTLGASSVSGVQSSIYQPGTVYFAVYNYGNGATTFYTYQNGSVSPSTSLTTTAFSQAYPEYFSSPSGNQTFWSQVRDGQNTLLTGDSSGQSPKTVVSSGSYKALGWYTDNYLLVTDKNNSQLYIMPLTGSQTPLKVADYYSSAQSLDYGYGNL